MKWALVVNHLLIALFGIASGAFKTMGGEADLQIFAHLGMGPLAVAIFGCVQLFSALATVPIKSRRGGAWVLATCNLLAALGLFAANVQPFGFISLVFIVMALLVLRRS